MKVTIKRAAVIASVVLGAAGGLIFADHPYWGSVLIVAGVAGAVYMYLSSERTQAENENFFDATSKLMFGSGAGNPYTERIKQRITKSGDYPNVFDDLDKALSIDPNDADALSYYCISAALHLSFRGLASSSNDPAVSKECDRLDHLIERGITTGKRPSDFYSAKGMVLDARGMHKEAREYYARAGELRGDPYWRLMMSTSYGMEADYLSAVREMETIIDEGRGNNSTVTFYYGRCLLYLGDYEEALTNFKRVRRARSPFYELLAAIEQAHYFSWHPIKSAFWGLLAALYLALRNRRKAFKHFRTAMRHVYWQPIIFVAKPIDRITKRLSCITGVKIKRLSHPDEPYFSLGNSLAKMKRYEAAQKMYAKASKSSHSVETWLNLCAASIACGDWNEAERAYNHVMKHWPENEIAKSHRELISNRGEVQRIIPAY